MIAIIGFTYTLFFLLSVVLAATNQANVTYKIGLNYFLVGVSYYDRIITLYPFFFTAIELDFKVYIKVVCFGDETIAGYIIGGSSEHLTLAETPDLYRFYKISKKEYEDNVCQSL